MNFNLHMTLMCPYKGHNSKLYAAVDRVPVLILEHVAFRKTSDISFFRLNVWCDQKLCHIAFAYAVTSTLVFICSFPGSAYNLCTPIFKWSAYACKCFVCLGSWFCCSLEAEWRRRSLLPIASGFKSIHPSWNWPIYPMFNSILTFTPLP